MDSAGFPWSLIVIPILLSAVSATISRTTPGANLSQVSPSQKASCQNMYNYNNFYSGSSKKIETLLTEVRKELIRTRNDVKSFKENKTIATGMQSTVPMSLDHILILY